jgi:hypothetical protein
MGAFGAKHDRTGRELYYAVATGVGSLVAALTAFGVAALASTPIVAIFPFTALVCLPLAWVIAWRAWRGYLASLSTSMEPADQLAYSTVRLDADLKAILDLGLSDPDKARLAKQAFRDHRRRCKAIEQSVTLGTREPLTYVRVATQNPIQGGGGDGGGDEDDSDYEAEEAVIAPARRLVARREP